MTNKKIVAVSGGLDPIGAHHCSMILEAGTYGDVVVILNSDKWLIRKKGYFFQSFEERKAIVLSIKGVVDVIQADDDDGTVCKSLELLNPDVFCNGGDRRKTNVPEIQVCDRLGIEMKWGVGGDFKSGSSSDTVATAYEKIHTLKQIKKKETSQ